MDPVEIYRKYYKGGIIIDAGCGDHEFVGVPYIGIDFLIRQQCNLCWDLNKGLPMFSDNSIAYINANNVLEHLEEPLFFIKECVRVLQKNGILCSLTPLLELVPIKTREERDYYRTHWEGNDSWNAKGDPHAQVWGTMKEFYKSLIEPISSQVDILENGYSSDHPQQDVIGFVWYVLRKK